MFVSTYDLLVLTNSASGFLWVYCGIASVLMVHFLVHPYMQKKRMEKISCHCAFFRVYLVDYIGILKIV